MSDEALAIIEFTAETEESTIDLGGLGLSALPAELFQLTKLTHLSVRGNQLTSLPAEIGQLVRLEQLSLADNQLVNLPPEMGQLTGLTHLNLRNNELTALPIELTRLTSLTRLQLSGNPLPLPAEIVAKWNQPAVILDYYRTHFVQEADPDQLLASPGSLQWILIEYLSLEELEQFADEICVPKEYRQGEEQSEIAAQLLDYHTRHELLEEFSELVYLWRNR